MMNKLLPALQFVALMFAGWVNRKQQEVIDYLLEENRVLRDQLGGRRLRLTNDQRSRLAAKGKLLGRAALRRFAGIVTLDTIAPADSNSRFLKLLRISTQTSTVRRLCFRISVTGCTLLDHYATLPDTWANAKVSMNLVTREGQPRFGTAQLYWAAEIWR